MNHEKQLYIANPTDQYGFVAYSKEEDKIWSELLLRQTALLQKRACNEYLQGLALLNLPSNRIPQLTELNSILKKGTTWQLEAVSALLPANEFFHLLANKKFPVATFIRRREDFNYIEEPDIFHEIVGHCPLLIHPPYADFMESYGKLSLSAPPRIQTLLERIFFFTIETGLIATLEGLRIYGGGILSSYDESSYALDSHLPIRKPFNINEVIQSSYSLQSMQKTYYIIDSFDILHALVNLDLIHFLRSYEHSI